MKRICFDTETYPFHIIGKATSNTVPRLVCMSYMEDGEGPFVLERERAVVKFRDWFLDSETHFIGHNVTFDMLVMVRALTEKFGPEGDWATVLFDVYAQQRVYDTILHRQLRRIDKIGTTKDTSYTLAFMVQRYLGIKVTGKHGEDVWRARYNELEGVRSEDYPKRAWEYAALDAQLTWQMWLELTKGQHYPNESFQLCADLAFKLQSAHGIMVDQDHVSWIYNFYANKAHKLENLLREAGVIRPDGSANTQAVKDIFSAAWRSLGKFPKLTDSGKGISTSKKTLEELKQAGFFDIEANDADAQTMRAYSEYKTTQKFIATYLEPLRDAGDYPICTRYITLVNSGRTASQAPNVQNFPARLNADERRAKEAGHTGPFGPDIRGCFVPREGCVFLVADYASIEMYSLAQVIANIAGEVTQLGRILNSGIDPHLYLLAHMTQKPYEDLAAAHKEGDAWTGRWRSIMKAANYSYGGGAQPSTFVEFCQAMGLKVSEAEAVRAYEAYHSGYPDVARYHFADIDRCEVRPNRFEIELHGPNRSTGGWMRRLCDRSTQAYNARFQGLVGAGFKYAAWNLAKENYVYKDSPLYGDRTVLSVHDEFGIEVKNERIEEKKERFGKVMEDSMKLFLPDMDVRVEVEVMADRWGK